MSGAGVTVTAPLASAADSLSVDWHAARRCSGGTARGMRRSQARRRRGRAAAPLAWTTLMRYGKRERIRGDETMGAAKQSPYHEAMELGETPQRVQGIVDAAERAARELREQAEERAAERIAEADRAGANRVQAPRPRRRRSSPRPGHRPSRRATRRLRPWERSMPKRGSSGRPLSRRPSRSWRTRTSAQRAGRYTTGGGSPVGETRAQSRRRCGRRMRPNGCSRRPGTGRAEACRGREALAQAVRHAAAQEEASEIRARARADAREIVGDANEIAREVLDDGTEVSRNLHDLSTSMRNNAERLLRDVRLTHGSMTARLDQAAPGAPPRRATPRPLLPRARRSSHDELDNDLDVPEFIPRG